MAQEECSEEKAADETGCTHGVLSDVGACVATENEPLADRLSSGTVAYSGEIAALDEDSPSPLLFAPRSGHEDRQTSEVRAMTWESPEFVEVKMDAEINSYQDDFDRDQDDRF